MASVPTLLSTAAVVHILLSLVLLLWHNVVDFVLMCQMPMALIACCRMPMTLRRLGAAESLGVRAAYVHGVSRPPSQARHISPGSAVSRSMWDGGWGMDGWADGGGRFPSLCCTSGGEDHKWGTTRPVTHITCNPVPMCPIPPHPDLIPRPGSPARWTHGPRCQNLLMQCRFICVRHQRDACSVYIGACRQCLYMRVPPMSINAWAANAPPVSIYARAANVYICVARQCALVIAAELKNAG